LEKSIATGTHNSERRRHLAVKREAEEDWGKADMSTTRTHFTFRIDAWTGDGEVKAAWAMDKDYLLLKRAALSRPSGNWNEDNFDVLANGEVVGRIYKAHAAPVGSPWM
jgi:hypothetical protein